MRVHASTGHSALLLHAYPIEVYLPIKINKNTHQRFSNQSLQLHNDNYVINTELCMCYIFMNR